MNHNMPPATTSYSAEPQMDWGSPGSPAADPTNSLVVYGNLPEPPKSVYELNQMLDPRDRLINTPGSLNRLQHDQYATPVRRSYAQIEVADQIAGTLPQFAQANTAPGWSTAAQHESFGPSQEQTDERVARLTHGHDTRSVGRVFIGALSGSVRAGLGEMFRRPDRQMLEDIVNGGISGGVNGRVYDGAKKAGEVYERLMLANEKTRRIYDGTDLREKMLEIEKRNRDPKDYDLAA